MLNLIILVVAAFMTGLGGSASWDAFRQTGSVTGAVIAGLGVAEVAGLAYLATQV